MRTVFLGTPELAVPSLHAMAANPEFRPLAVFTQPAARRSRRGHAEPSPVALEARKLGLTVHEVEKVSVGEPLEQLIALAPEVIVVVAFGQILRRQVLELPRHGCLNFHPSMLPQFRGAAPVQRAVLAGVVDSGLTIMRLVKALDAGPILLQRPWRMDPARTAEDLLAEAGQLGAPMLLEVLSRLETGIESHAQDDSLATLAPPLEKADGELHFHEPAADILNRIRAVQPWPRAQAWLNANGREIRLIVHRAQAAAAVAGASPGQVVAINRAGISIACGRDAVCLTQVQLEGKPARPAFDVANGLRLSPGARFRD